MWKIDDYTLVNYVLVGDRIQWKNQIILVKDVVDEGDLIKIIGEEDSWSEDIEVFIPDCSTVPLMVQD